MAKTVYVHYTAPTEVECVVAAPSQARAAKALGTTSQTMLARSKIYRSPEQVPENLHQAMALACERPERVIINTEGAWKALSGDPANILMNERQRSLKSARNAMIGDTPMEIHSITCDATTWSQFLSLGGSKWFRKAVAAAHKKEAVKTE